jgi:hypothetical protein
MGYIFMEGMAGCTNVGLHAGWNQPGVVLSAEHPPAWASTAVKFKGEGSVAQLGSDYDP